MCRFSDFLDEIWNLYDDEDTAGHAMSTGWKDVDRYYRVRLLHAALVSIFWKYLVTQASADLSPSTQLPDKAYLPHNSLQILQPCRWCQGSSPL